MTLILMRCHSSAQLHFIKYSKGNLALVLGKGKIALLELRGRNNAEKHSIHRQLHFYPDPCSPRSLNNVHVAGTHHQWDLASFMNKLVKNSVMMLLMGGIKIKIIDPS